MESYHYSIIAPSFPLALHYQNTTLLHYYILSHPEFMQLPLLFEDLVVSPDQSALQWPDLRLEHGIFVFWKIKDTIWLFNKHLSVLLTFRFEFILKVGHKGLVFICLVLWHCHCFVHWVPDELTLHIFHNHWKSFGWISSITLTVGF